MVRPGKRKIPLTGKSKNKAERKALLKKLKRNTMNKFADEHEADIMMNQFEGKSFPRTRAILGLIKNSEARRRKAKKLINKRAKRSVNKKVK